MRKKLTHEALKACEKYITKVTGQRTSTVFGIVHPDGQLLRCIECIGGEWLETDKPAHIYTAEKLERAVKSNKRFVIVIGGRGSMKSVGVVDIMLAGVMDHGDKVYCLREYQESIAESVHALNKEEIKRLQLDGFTIQDAAIYSESGGELKYRGLARNPESVKSAAGFRRFFVEEAATLSDASINNLTPTARNKAKFGLPDELIDLDDEDLGGVQMFFVANPNSSSDPFSKRFINPFLADLNKNGYYEDDLHLIIQMNYKDNPWFALSGLEQERLFDFENKPRAVYDHVWLGAFLDTVDNSIIEAEWFDACIDAHEVLGFTAQGQEKMAYDPADSGDDKAVAIQHGSVVLGVSSSSAGLIDTATDWATSFAIKLKPDVFMWDADGVGLGLKRQINDALSGKKIKLVPFHGSGMKYAATEAYDAIEGEKWAGEEQRTNEQMFTNLRAQCYWALRDRIFKTYLAVKKGRYYSPDELISFSSGISEMTQLRAEVCRIPRKYVASGRIQILSKQEMKAMKIASPNLADAVMMLQMPIDIYEDYEEEYTPERTGDGWA
jgi:phage terminase large subunit